MALLAAEGRRTALRRECLRGAFSLSLILHAGLVIGAGPANVDDEADDALTAVPVGAASRAPAPPPDASRRELTPTGKLAAPAMPEETWMMPPIPWRAAISLGTDRSRSGDGSTSGSTNTTLSAGASSYILAPWFLPLGGNASFNRNSQSSGSRSDSASLSLSGNVMPRSPAPASFGVAAGKSRFSAAGSESTSGFRNMNWAQTYNPLNGAFTSNYNVDASKYEGSGAAVSSLSVSASAGGGLPGTNPQNLGGNVGYSRSGQAGTGRGSESRRMGANHSIYLEDYVMTISTDGSISQLQVRGEGAQTAAFGSAGTQMDWIPSDDYPLRLQASARHFVSDTSLTGGLAITQKNTVASVSAQYPHNKNWTFGGKSQVNRSENSTGTTTAHETSASASWSGDGVNRKWRDAWDYTLGYRSSLAAEYSGVKSDATGTSGESSVSRAGGNWAGGLGQSLARRLTADRPGEAGAIRLSQNADAYKRLGAAASPATLVVSHSAAYDLSFLPTPLTTRSLSFSANDGRSFGASRSSYQSISANATGRDQFNARESVSWSAGIPVSRQGSGRRWQGSASAQLSYSHGRFANVSGLVYGANYSLTLRPRDQGGADTSFYGGWVTGQTFSQSWSWRMGHLSWSATNAVVLDEFGRTSGSVGLSVSRSFGGVL